MANFSCCVCATQVVKETKFTAHDHNYCRGCVKKLELQILEEKEGAEIQNRVCLIPGCSYSIQYFKIDPKNSWGDQYNMQKKAIIDRKRNEKNSAIKLSKKKKADIQQPTVFFRAYDYKIELTNRLKKEKLQQMQMQKRLRWKQECEEMNQRKNQQLKKAQIREKQFKALKQNAQENQQKMKEFQLITANQQKKLQEYEQKVSEIIHQNKQREQKYQKQITRMQTTFERRLYQKSKLLDVLIIKEQPNPSNQCSVDWIDRSLHLGSVFARLDQIIERRKDVPTKLQEIIALTSSKNILLTFYGMSGSGKSTSFESIIHATIKQELSSNSEIFLRAIQVRGREQQITVQDLLSSEKTSLKSLDGKKTSILIPTLSQLQNRLVQIQKLRITKKTPLNPESSRTHLWIELVINGRHLIFLDLAGRQRSERWWGDDIQSESIFINSSLTNFSSCISAIRTRGRNPLKKDALIQWIEKFAGESESILVNIVLIDVTDLKKSQQSLTLILGLKDEEQKQCK